MDMFGNIPLVTTVNEDTENAEQASRPEVYKFIVKELQEVAPLLPTGHSNHAGVYYGRVTRSVANFLLAKFNGLMVRSTLMPIGPTISVLMVGKLTLLLTVNR